MSVDEPSKPAVVCLVRWPGDGKPSVLMFTREGANTGFPLPDELGDAAFDRGSESPSDPAVLRRILDLVSLPGNRGPWRPKDAAISRALATGRSFDQVVSAPRVESRYLGEGNFGWDVGAVRVDADEVAGAEAMFAPEIGPLSEAGQAAALA